MLKGHLHGSLSPAISVFMIPRTLDEMRDDEKCTYVKHA